MSTEKIRQPRVRTGVLRRRLVATVSVTAATAAALVGFASPAEAATGPSAQLRQGTLTVTGTAARDVVDIEVSHDQLTVDFGFDGNIDGTFSMSRLNALAVHLGDGDDGLAVLGTGVGDIPTSVDLGAGNDFTGVFSFETFVLAGTAPVALIGGDGNDQLSVSVVGPSTVDTGVGDDTVDVTGNLGAIKVDLGPGNDQYKSGQNAFSLNRNEIVDGGTGLNTLAIDGDDTSETVNVSGVGGHLIATDSSGSNVDAVNISSVTYTGHGANGEGFGDSFAVSDLTGTGVTNVTPIFSDPFDPTVPNNSADTVSVFGTPGDDLITISGSGNSVTVAGLTPLVTPQFMNSNDTLQVITLGGRDRVDSSRLPHGFIQLLVF